MTAAISGASGRLVLPVAEVSGCVPWGGRTARAVPVHEGDVFYIGRYDRRWLERSGERLRHLALGPTTRPVVSAASLIVVGLRDAVEVRRTGGATPAVVDGESLGLDPVWLGEPVHEIIIDPLGVPQRVLIRVHAGRSALAPDPGRSGSTVEPVLVLSGEAMRRMAAALAWPLVAKVPPPRVGGWSTAAIGERFRELWGEPPQRPRRLLHDLREALVTACGADGRPLLAVPELQPWPWPAQRDPLRYPTEQSFIEAKNHITAMHLAASGVVGDLVIESLDRVR